MTGGTTENYEKRGQDPNPRFPEYEAGAESSGHTSYTGGPGSNIGTETSYHDRRSFCGFTHPSQANTGIEPSNRSQLQYFRSFPGYDS